MLQVMFVDARNFKKFSSVVGTDAPRMCVDSRMTSLAFGGLTTALPSSLQRKTAASCQVNRHRRVALTTTASNRGRRLAVSRTHKAETLPSDGARLKGTVFEDPATLRRLHRLLRSPTFLARVAKRGRCNFARFSGVIFKKEEVFADCPDGIPLAMQHYQKDLSYVVVSVPPGIVARSVAQPKRVPGTEADAYSQHLANSVADVPLAAVFTRHGVDSDVLQREQAMLDAQAAELEVQLRAWSDVGDVRRVESNASSVDGVNLYEESLDDLLGMA
jgi:hypothetical protein